jgi:ABC-2 type transport system permease protein
VAPRRTVRVHLADLWEYRELLGQLVRRELKVKYRDSTLGFAWSLLNPAFVMGIYYLVFQVFLATRIARFPIWLLAGILVWNFFSGSLAAGTGSITANNYLIGKVRFPREVLPLASVGAAAVHWFLQSLVLFGVIAAFQTGVAWAYFPAFLIALVTAVVLGSSLAILLGAVNVYARDTTHLLELTLMAWFWLTPIIWQWELAASKLRAHGVTTNLLLVNPMTSVIISFQRFLYGKTVVGHGAARAVLLPSGSVAWFVRNDLIVLGASLVLFVLAIRLFDRAEGNFAEAI